MKLYIIWEYDGYEEPQVFYDPEEALLYLSEYEKRKLKIVIMENG